MRLRITSIQNFLVFLKRLKSVEKSVILELDKERIYSKVHTPDKTVMKYSSLLLKDVLEGEIDWISLKTNKVKVGIMDIGRLMEAFRHFRPEEDVYFELTIEKVDGEMTATEIRLNSDSLKIKFKCADLGLLSYVDDKTLDIIHDKENPSSKFVVYQSDFTTVLSLCGMETNSEEILEFVVEETRVHACGDSFRYRINLGPGEIMTSKQNSVYIYKNQLSYMEAETCDMYVHENRIIMVSRQSATSIAIGLVEK